MRFIWNCLGFLLVLGAGVFGARPALADTYSVYTVSLANGNIDQAVFGDGTAMVYGSSCGAGGDRCYKTYDHGQLATVSSTQPATAWDNGSACTFSVAGYQVSGRCNGNYEAFAFSMSNPLAKVMAPGLYAGALDDLGLVYGSPYQDLAAVFLNSHGDLAFADTGLEELYQAYNTTPAPEPGSMVLLVTGLGMGVLLQRRVLG